MAKDILNVGGFTILRRIGIGARSTIYLATDDENKADVALKRVLFQRPEDRRIFEQVENEFKTAQKIDHPYIRKCHKLKKIRSMLKVKEMLLSMEYFDGMNLEDCPPLSLGDVLLVFRMVATALNAMHQHGFVHCDIKPNNILMNKAGSIQIIDLGQSCRIGTVKHRIQGTPDYIAPEQVKRKPLNPKTDIFNLGATMYWAMTGKHAPTLIPKKNKFGIPVTEPRRAPNEIKKKIPQGVSNLVMDCIEDDPMKRPNSMMAVISRLDLMIHNIFGEKIQAGKNATNNNRVAQ
ncbi:MAG: serine/threonine protein kinase [Sedimentisphaerales bacterium]|nr:serine/threonine protein kinase [Sedimentisphaerales bacterium]